MAGGGNGQKFSFLADRGALYWVGFSMGQRPAGASGSTYRREAEVFQRFFRDPSASLWRRRRHLPHLSQRIDRSTTWWWRCAGRGFMSVAPYRSPTGSMSLALRRHHADGKVHEAEALAIKRRFELDPELAQSAKVARFIAWSRDALMDGNLDDDEQRDIRNGLSAWLATAGGRPCRRRCRPIFPG